MSDDDYDLYVLYVFSRENDMIIEGEDRARLYMHHVFRIVYWW